MSELEDNQRNCSECKKLLEIREVAKKLPSNLWKALDLIFLSPAQSQVKQILIARKCDTAAIRSIGLLNIQSQTQREGEGRGGGKRRGERRREARRGKRKRANSPQSLSLFPFSPIRHFSLVTRKIVTIRSFLMTDKCHK